MARSAQFDVGTLGAMHNFVLPKEEDDGMPTSPFEKVRAARREDLPFLVEQHLAFFPDGFFARLGQRFLVEYYRSFLSDKTSCVLVAESGGRPIGYLVGTPRPHLHRQHVMSRHGRQLGLLGFAALLRRPRLIPPFLRTRGRRYLGAAFSCLQSRRSEAVSDKSESFGVLHHVAVLPEHQGLGVGSSLIRNLEQSALTAGCDRLLLVTRSDSLGPGYCRAAGWSSLGERCTDEGPRLTTFSRSLDGSLPSFGETAY